MGIDAKIQEYKKMLDLFPNAQEKYQYLIEQAKNNTNFPEELRNDNFKVSGCQSQVWLIPEKKAIGEYVLNLEKPFLGFCLGCQLLGEVLGGQVVKSSPSEIGVLDIHSQEDIKIDPLFNFLPQSFKALQWHSYEVAGLENNKDVSVLGSSPTTKYQIFGYKKFAYGIQFHVEIRNSTVDDWAAVPEYKNALEESLGSDALPEMKNAVNAEISIMQDQCKMLYQNFLKIISD